MSAKKLGWDWGRKNCPVCATKFDAKIGNMKEQKYCSTGCSNKARITPVTKLKDYRTIAERFHKMECCVCGEDRTVAIHHWFEGYKDQVKTVESHRPENLIPICPTEHILFHTIKYRRDIEPAINRYRQRWIDANGVQIWFMEDENGLLVPSDAAINGDGKPVAMIYRGKLFEMSIQIMLEPGITQTPSTAFKNSKIVEGGHAIVVDEY